MFLPGNKTQGHLRWASPWFLRFGTKEHRHTAGDTIPKSSQRPSAEREEHPPIHAHGATGKHHDTSNLTNHQRNRAGALAALAITLASPILILCYAAANLYETEH